MKEYVSETNQLSITKKLLWYKVRGQVSYLAIRNYSDDLKITQFEVGDWQEKDIDWVLNNFFG